MAEWLSARDRKRRINRIRELASDEQRVELVNIVYTDCPICGYDLIKQEAKDSACSTCGGTGKVGTETSIVLLAKVRWIDPMEETIMKTGYLPIGGVTFTIDSDFEDNVDGSEKILVDGIQVQIISKRYRGFPKVNRVTYDCEPVKNDWVNQSQ